MKFATTQLLNKWSIFFVQIQFDTDTCTPINTGWLTRSVLLQRAMIIMKLAISHLLCVDNGIIDEDEVENFEDVFTQISYIFLSAASNLRLMTSMYDESNNEVLGGERMPRKFLFSP